ncbi:MAG: thioredoxin family protein [Nitrospinae bacterium]|nr:thioredoxin family protein [Nitrospinota bacterium]
MTKLTARRLAGLCFAAAFFIFGGSAAFSAEIAPFDQAKFAEAQTAGKTIIVHVHAPWCPTCRRQTPIVESLAKDQMFSNAAVFRVDFDTEKQALKFFKVQYQATLIVFKGKTEVARSTGESDAGKIKAMFQKGL